MIVVLGVPVAGRDQGGEIVATGLAAAIARAAAAAGADVELVGRVGDDPVGEALVIALGRSEVGHRALLRDARPTLEAPTPAPADQDEPVVAALLGHEEADLRPSRRPAPSPGLDAADVAMGLRYLPEFRVLVTAVALDEAASRAVADAAEFNGAALVVVTPPGGRVPAGLPEATILEAPDEDPDGAFAAFAARFSVALDAGAPAAVAFRDATAAGGWERTDS